MLTDAQIRLIEESYQEISFHLTFAGDRFYEYLFEMHPEVRPLFKNNMSTQSMKLMQMIGYAVANLHTPDVLNSVVIELGQRHVGYGIQRHHYAYVGEALLKTLGELLGAQFTPEVRQAWQQLYNELVALANQEAA